MYNDGKIKSYPVNPQSEFTNSSDFVVFWVITNNTTSGDIIQWMIVSPDEKLVKNGSIKLTGQSGLGWASYYQRVSDLNISGTWHTRVTYIQTTQEKIQETAFLNFSIKTPLKNTTGNQTPNLASDNSGNGDVLFFFTVFLLLIILGSSYFLLIRSKKNKISMDKISPIAIPPEPSLPIDSKSSLEDSIVPLPKSNTDSTDRMKEISDKTKKLGSQQSVNSFESQDVFIRYADEDKTTAEAISPGPSFPGDSKSSLENNKIPVPENNTDSVDRMKVSDKVKKLGSPQSVNSFKSHDVFISYANEDKATAEAICAKLEKNQIQCWIAPRDVAPGDKYVSSLVHAIDTSKIFIVIFSRYADKSPHVRTEVERAFNLEKTIIPFRVENIEPSVEIQYFIGTRQWLDAFTPTLEHHINRLIVVLERKLNKSSK
jgi:hypothetical protein